ncbi:disease resistance protein RGA2-like [Camellia sinensis]|uniref:disease resistance protein RGA2-like n=1 Tax=Camellia sinensis TaxID=4442 RepID=UPI001035D186|nr:disease resistance protein RGA2-like [Camellia sinensis]
MLDEIVLDMSKFKFVVRSEDRTIEIKRREETSSFVRSVEVIGREREKEVIVQLLVSSSGDENVDVIPIVGMGGLGKTILAQSIYNDNKIECHFSKRLWVCVSDDFDIKRILVKILKALGDNTCDNVEIDQLQSHVRGVLSHQKIFLVLDDVWNEDPVEWAKLRDMLIVGARGSRIVVTTRSRKVASIVHTMDPYELKGLSDDECLSILVKWAFEKGEESKHQNLINIGRDIVKKCGGVPLAARTLGAALHSKTNERDWLSVRDSEIWAYAQNKNDILPVLRLSYDQMPSYLKQCFAYCSLFEKDQIIGKHELIYYWMAQGFIESLDNNEELEDTGQNYIDELVRRSFLQYEGGEAYKMHDLVHDLAEYVAGSECLTVKRTNSKVNPDKVRHVSFDSSSYGELPRPLIEAKKLRTILFPSKRQSTFGSSVETIISSFRCLRVVNFNNPDIEDNHGQRFNFLSKNVVNLKHLRYLNMKYCYGMQTLPKGFGNSLLNLQYLNLYGSALCELPEDFGKLINLRFLGLSSMLTCLPEKQIGGLTSLQELQLYDSFELTALGEGIGKLTCLRKLEIKLCPMLTSLPFGMRYLTALEHLKISHCFALKFSGDNDLQGLRRLKSLTLVDLPRLVSLPKGLQDAADTLNQFKLQSCENLTTVSEFVLPCLTSLQELEIYNCPNLLSLPKDMQHLTELRCLSIKGCKHLSRRCEKGIGEDWPKIAHVPEIEIDYI